MRAVLTFLRRLWRFGSGADAAAGARREEQLTRHGHQRRGRDWVG